MCMCGNCTIKYCVHLQIDRDVYVQPLLIERVQLSMRI